MPTFQVLHQLRLFETGYVTRIAHGEISNKYFKQIRTAKDMGIFGWTTCVGLAHGSHHAPHRSDRMLFEKEKNYMVRATSHRYISLS